MTASDRDGIVAALRKEEARVSANAQQACEKAKALEAELKGVRAGLAALTGPPKRGSEKAGKVDVR